MRGIGHRVPRSTEMQVKYWMIFAQLMISTNKTVSSLFLNVYKILLMLVSIKFHRAGIFRAQRTVSYQRKNIPCD